MPSSQHRPRSLRVGTPVRPASLPRGRAPQPDTGGPFGPDRRPATIRSGQRRWSPKRQGATSPALDRSEHWLDSVLTSPRRHRASRLDPDSLRAAGDAQARSPPPQASPTRHAELQRPTLQPTCANIQAIKPDPKLSLAQFCKQLAFWRAAGWSDSFRPPELLRSEHGSRENPSLDSLTC